MFNSQKAPDLKVKDVNKGLYYRFGPNISDIHLLTGTFERHEVKDIKQLLEKYQGSIEEGAVSLRSDPVDTYIHIMDALQNEGSMAIQDDFFIWYVAHQPQNLGKAFIMDPTDYSVQHIFFDDNARVSSCNVDVRELQTGKPIVERKYRDKNVVCVDTMAAILENDYFLK